MSRKLIDLGGIADLLGVSPVTPPQWRQRSRRGEMHPPLPEPDEPEIPDKPLWREETIIDWAKRTGRWPKGTAARPTTRGPRGPRVHAA